MAVTAVAAVPTLGGPAELRCRLADPRIDESSGVAAASWSDHVVFTNNDSGDGARFFAVDARTCATLAASTVNGAASVDWEDMARGTAGDGTPVLWLADIGDNSARRTSVVVYEVAEPPAARPGGTLPIRSRWQLTYPDGAADAETLLVDTETGRPVVITKDVAGGRSRAYRVPASGSGVLEPLARIDVKALPGGSFAGPAWSLTGGATAPDRRTVVLRTYLAAWTWSASPGEPLAAVLGRPPTELDIPFSRQPEAISFTRDGRGLWVTSEGASSPLHLIPLAADPAGPGAQAPPAPPSEAAAPPPASTSPGPQAADRRASLLGVLIVAAGATVLAAALLAIGLLRRRRRRA